MGVKTITDVVTEPITLVDLRAHVRIDAFGIGPAHPDDAMLMSKLAGAREFAEHYTQRTLAGKTLELALDAFPDGAILLPRAPVSSIVSVKYIDAAGIEQTLSNSLYALDDYSFEHWLLPAYNSAWPATGAATNAVKVRYLAGYTNLPKSLREGLLLLVGHLYENRQEATTLKVEQIPAGMKTLFNTHRVPGL